MVRIRVEAVSNDPYARYHGLSIDSDLPANFWTVAPGRIVGMRFSPFRYETEVDLPPGNHYVVYGNSADPTYPWTANVYVDGTLVGSGIVHRDRFLKASFTIGPGAPGIPSWVLVAGGAVVLGLLLLSVKTGKWAR
jgi:hypothetical protein